MNIIEYLKQNRIYLDGGTGTLLQAAGLQPGELPERWNLSHPDVLRSLHKSYYDAGSNVVSANTFGANTLKFSEPELEQIIAAAISHVKYAREASLGEQPKWVALDIGPTGRMLKPLGDLDFETAVEIFAKTVRLGVKYGADLFFIQTMNDSLETKAALLAVKENSSLPVFVGNAYGSDGKLMTGADSVAMVAMLEGMGADAIGVNCSLGPAALSGVIEKYLEYSSLPVILKANAGLPRIEDGRTVYDLSAGDFAADSASLVGKGVKIVGGCCGTTPEYIESLVKSTSSLPVKQTEKKNHTLASSYTHAVCFDTPVLIGERINPTGKPLVKQALRSGDIDYLLREAVSQSERGAHILDVNVGLPDINEAEMLSRCVYEIQSVCDLPLQIDTASPTAMERAMRSYNGKAMINSVNGKRESMEAVFPLVKKYGGLLVALTLDEQGIPDKAEGRLAIARKILAEAEKYGIYKKDIIFDPLAMSVSADRSAAAETLLAVEMIGRELGCRTSLGVSNVSFGLPERDMLNSTFFTLALGRGLSAAIMNPYSDSMLRAYRAFNALSGADDNFEEYISFATGLESKPSSKQSDSITLRDSIIKGLRENAAAKARELLSSVAPLDVVNNEIIPALDVVGVGFEQGKVYLPGLLMSAEAAGAAFEVIRSAVPKGEGSARAKIVIATVKGDIHDIGKNIVKLILENYGYDVTDLGKDVAPERIVSEVKRLGADFVGLSALMTTTLPSMEETVRLVRLECPSCRVIVGGAVLTAEYAARIGADKYATDALDAVRYLENELKL